MKTSLNKYEPNIGSMKEDTHTLTQLEELMLDYYNRLVNAITKQEKQEIRKKLKFLEQQWNNVEDKHTNGHKYPKRMPHLYDPTPYTEKQKKEALKLIDEDVSGQDERSRTVDFEYWSEHIRGQDLDVSGVSPGKNRFKFEEKGWAKPAFEGRKV